VISEWTVKWREETLSVLLVIVLQNMIQLPSCQIAIPCGISSKEDITLLMLHIKNHTEAKGVAVKSSLDVLYFLNLFLPVVIVMEGSLKC
jgi:hypothetical protein